MIQACGPVQISKGEEFYTGATRVTNNTAEMQGVSERSTVLAEHVRGKEDSPR